MTQSLDDYRLALLERSLRIKEGNHPPNWYLPETVQLAQDATNFLHFLLEAVIAAGVPLTVPPGEAVSQPPTIADLRNQCCELAKRLHQMDLELVGCIAQLVRLESERAQKIAETYVRPSAMSLHRRITVYTFRLSRSL